MSRIRIAVTALVLTLLGVPGLAQHAGHDMGSGALDMALHTMPADDAVLAAAPDSVMLHFGDEVRLVKLALRNADSDFVDIGFRYDATPHRDFSHALPSLPAADYYTVEWGVIDDDGTLVRGRFHFAFGSDARPPSFWLEQQQQMRHIMAPDYRLLGPDAQ